jgi:hypothetical protein
MSFSAIIQIFFSHGFENEAALSMRDDGSGGSFNGAVQSVEQHHKKPKSSELLKGSSENGVTVCEIVHTPDHEP